MKKAPKSVIKVSFIPCRLKTKGQGKANINNAEKEAFLSSKSSFPIRYVGMIINEPMITVNNLTQSNVTPKGKTTDRRRGYKGGYCGPM